ncbi:MAG: hypothetical protein QGH39_03475, partial [Candidatus Thermoplasmatota archaeon]|nr:hypothetical protein [Candidatus Thermoplasmatota archaeon]
EIIVHALKAGELQKEDLVKLIKMALDAGELKLEDISFILKIGHKFRIFNEDTIHHLLTRLHQEGSLTGEDILLILVLVRRDGDLSEKVMVHILIKALGEGFLDKEKFAKMLKWAFKQGHIGEDEIRFILEWAYRHGEEFNITKEDIEALLNRLHKDEIVRMIKLMDIIDAKAIERNTIQFADNWQRVGKMTWVSDVEVWSDANSNESYTVPAYFQVHGVEKVLELVDWVHHRNMTKGVFFGFMMKGGYLYPAAHRVFHDPNFVGEVNYFSPPGADQVVPDKIDDTGKIEYDDFDSVSEANIPLNKDEVVEVEFKNRQGQKVVCKFKGEGTVSWQWVEDSDIPDKANSDVPEGRITIGNFIVADIEGKLDWFYMEIHYDDADIPDTVNEADLMLYYWDEDSNGWQKCENTKVDTLNNIVYANVTHFTIFAPMAEQKQVGSDAGKDDGVSVLIMVLILLVVVFLIATIIAMFVRKKKDDTGLDVSEKDLPINEDDADWDRYQE